MTGQTYDFLVLGSGMAGLFAALQLAPHGKVALITKKTLEESNSYFAQGGMAAAIGELDSPALHLQDTLMAGVGLCDQPVVQVLVQEAFQRVMDLMELGVNFDRFENQLALGKEGAHSFNRILHVDGDSTGRVISTNLADHVRNNKDIHIYEGHFAIELIISQNYCHGALVLHEGQVTPFWSRACILATGGAGHIFAETSNPSIATGDGLALAYRAGAQLMDMEFFQFHPTVFHGDQRFLISEAVRGEGAVLRNVHGTAFMQDYHPYADLAPRDVVSRVIWKQMEATNHPHVYLDATQLNKVDQRFPTIYKHCMDHGLVMQKDWLPVSPAAHYLMGGVLTDLNGQTSIQGLYACGEVACTGVHGANRLASNSLLETLVFGRRAALAALECKSKWGKSPIPSRPIVGPHQKVEKIRRHLQKIAWKYIGLQRENTGFDAAQRELDQLQELYGYWGSHIATWEVCNMYQVMQIMLNAAKLREESRGAHYRIDYPETSVGWAKHIILQKENKPVFRQVWKGEDEHGMGFCRKILG